jgi:hypothetical protein
MGTTTGVLEGLYAFHTRRAGSGCCTLSRRASILVPKGSETGLKATTA